MTVQERSGDHFEEIQYHLECLQNANREQQLVSEIEYLRKHIANSETSISSAKTKVIEILNEGLRSIRYCEANEVCRRGDETTREEHKMASLVRGSDLKRLASAAKLSVNSDGLQHTTRIPPIQDTSFDSKTPMQRKLSHDNTSLDGSHSGNPNSTFQEEKVSLNQQDSELGDGTNTPSSTASEIRVLPQQPRETRRDLKRRFFRDRVRLEDKPYL